MMIDKLNTVLETGTRAELEEFCDGHGLEMKDGKIYHKDRSVVEEQVTYWDKKQHVKKIMLNSVYGAILNAGCRYVDKRVGQSTTLSGRSLTKHMAAKTNEMLTGKYDHEGETIIAGDTDSVMFTASPVFPKEQELELDLDIATDLYDYISNEVSDSFPQFLKENFNVPFETGKILKAGREVIGSTGLFIKKKRYAINCLDIEGYRPEGGKMKIMGLDIKRADTPEFVQEFLESLLKDCLDKHTEEQIIQKIRDYKSYFRSLKPWMKGTPKRVNNLTNYKQKIHEQDVERVNKKFNMGNNSKIVEKRKSTIPGHVRASINWNYLLELNNDHLSMRITDGAKVIVCKVNDPSINFTSVAYPIDELNLPKWFKELKFDERGMEESILDQKIKNVIGQMGFDLSKTQQAESTLGQFFEGV